MPRLLPVDRAALPDSYHVLDEYPDELPPGVDVAYWNDAATVRTLGNNPALAAAHVNANTSVWIHSGLDLAEVELVILAVARELESRYEWHAHSMIAHNRAGVPIETITAISNRALGSLDPMLEALVEYVFEFVARGGDVDDRTHDRLAEFYDDDQLVGIAMLAGYYVMLDHLISAFGLEVHGEFVGWDLANVDPDHPRFS